MTAVAEISFSKKPTGIVADQIGGICASTREFFVEQFFAEKHVDHGHGELAVRTGANP